MSAGDVGFLLSALMVVWQQLSRGVVVMKLQGPVL